MIVQKNVGILKRVVKTGINVAIYIGRYVKNRKKLDTVIIIDANMSTLYNASDYYKVNADKTTADIYIQLDHNRISEKLAGARSNVATITNTKEQIKHTRSHIGGKAKIRILGIAKTEEVGPHRQMGIPQPMSTPIEIMTRVMQMGWQSLMNQGNGMWE